MEVVEKFRESRGVLSKHGEFRFTAEEAVHTLRSSGSPAKV